MSENQQEGYKTLGWIINKSEQGLFLVVADEATQMEIVEIYRRGLVEIYDYRRHPGEYSFRDLQEWVSGLPETRIFMVANFHLAVQTKESLNRLNFSRDMIEGLGRNFIFLVTPYGDDQLAVGAYDFYSFIRLRIIFDNDRICEKKEELPLPVREPVEESEWGPEESKQNLAVAYVLTEQAEDEADKANYSESEKLLLKAWEIKEKLLGAEHPEVAETGYLLAYVYERQGKYEEAEELYKKSLRLSERILGEEHPDTAISYNNLAGVYESQGKYKKALSYFLRAYKICASTLGIKHPTTEIVLENMIMAFVEWNPEGDFEQWMEKAEGIEETTE